MIKRKMDKRRRFPSVNTWRRSTNERLSNADRGSLIKRNRFHINTIKAKWRASVDITETVCFDY